MTVENADYDVLEKIGQGSFGVIRKVRRKADGEVLCRKEISYTRMSDREKEQLHAELRILETLRHPNIVRYCHRQHLKSSHDLHLYMEYCGNGDLGGYIRKLKDRNQLAEEDFIWTIFAQLVSALYRCHYGEDPPVVGKETGVRSGKALVSKQGHTVILHRDLKPENVFLGENNSVKLGDFGLSKIIASHDFASTYVGTPFYMSPEICQAERYSHLSDIWSLGCIIYELATRQVPFEARAHYELIMKIKKGVIKPLPSNYSPELSEAIAWCLKVDSRQRPDTAQLLNLSGIKLARTRLEQSAANMQLVKAEKDRDSALAKLATAQQDIQDLQNEVAKLRDASKKIEMEWHTRATLAIDQKVHEAVEKQKAELLAQFEAAVDQRAEKKVALHLASLPAAHGANQNPATSFHIRSSTPPPGKNAIISSFSTVASTYPETDASSLPEILDESVLDTDLTSLSLNDGDDASPLARRTKILPPPKKAARRTFTRAKTFAAHSGHTLAGDAAVLGSPMDVQMADPSPMPRQPVTIKGLSLSPRRNLRGELIGGEPVKRLATHSSNIFSLAQEKENRPPVRGRTLLELAQSPAKWHPSIHGEEMPSPFVKRR